MNKNGLFGGTEMIKVNEVTKSTTNLGCVLETSDLNDLRELKKKCGRNKRLYFTAYKYIVESDLGSPSRTYDRLFYPHYNILEVPRKECNKNPNVLCGAGINVASNSWAIRVAGGTYGHISIQFKIIELKIDLCDIVCIPKDHEGKFRVCKVFVIGREL